jgi:hypothetical protein
MKTFQGNSMYVSRRPMIWVLPTTIVDAGIANLL